MGRCPIRVSWLGLPVKMNLRKRVGEHKESLRSKLKKASVFDAPIIEFRFHGKDTYMYMLFDLMAQVYIWFTRPECPVFMSDQ